MGGSLDLMVFVVDASYLLTVHQAAFAGQVVAVPDVEGLV